MPERTNRALLVTLDREARTGLARQLEDRLRTLPPGTVLPPSRRLAADLGIARGTVVRAYAQLRHDGVLEARVGSGTRVVDRGLARRAPVDGRPALRLDLHPEVTDLTAFPRRAWLRAYGDAVRELPDRALGYADAAGLTDLRVELAAHLARTRGVRCSPEQVVVCGGQLAGFALVQAALAATGTRCLHQPRVSHPALARHRAVDGPARGWLDVDGGGARVEALPQRAREAVLVEPAHAYPSGTPMAPARVDALLTWAQRHDGLVVESDASAELHHHGPGPPSLQGRLPDRTLLIGSTSRALAPGLRIGWVVAPEDLVGAVIDAKRGTGPGEPVLEQLALARLVAAGELDRHLARLRRTYRARSAGFARLVACELPEVEVSAPDSGFHLVLGLPRGTTEDAVIAAAAQDGTRVVGLGRHVLHGPALAPGLVVGFGAVPEAAVPRAVGALRRAIVPGT